MRSHARLGRVPGSQEPAQLAEQLGIDLDPELLLLALTHRSFAYENGGLPHNERLEFLGDSVLSIVVTDALYRTHPDLAEGRLAKMRASVVNMRALAAVARGIGPGGLGAYLRLGHGEEVTGGRDKPSILADALEALLGAVYLGCGIGAAFDLVHQLFDPLLVSAASQGAALDWKTSLQELTAVLGLGVPDYVLTSEGPDHERHFTARALVGPEQFDPRGGRNKKEAEQGAAAAAWTVLKSRSGIPPTPVSVPVPVSDDGAASDDGRPGADARAKTDAPATASTDAPAPTNTVAPASAGEA